ncbi:MAG: hypothetical protein V5A79_07120 [Candidatus Bipolaricaulota bacterium]
MWSFLTFVISLTSTYFLIEALLPRLESRGIVGEDVNKPKRPEVAEMGGLAMVLGLATGLLFMMGLKTFVGIFKSVNSIPLSMALLTVFIIATIGFIDDLLGIQQAIKASVPLFASVPLMMIEAGQTHLGLPLIDFRIEFGLFYPLVLIPLGVTGAANAVNMLAGFNGLESGMAAVAFLSLGAVAFFLGEATSLLILVAAFGAVVATLYFNWFPARILIGDVGTFSIGALIASAVIIGNYEFAGVVIIIPYLADFLIKAFNGFPSEGWWGELEDGKLYCPEGPPKGLAQLVMKITGGISEQFLVLTLIGIEAVFGLLAVVFYL